MKSFVALVIGVLCYGCTPLCPDKATLVDLSRTEFEQRSFKVVHNPKEERCLTEALYYEAGNQSQIGKEAVALVIMNRVGAKGRPKTICGVVQQAQMIQEKTICQFSFWCTEKPQPNKILWKETSQISHRVLQSFWKRDILQKYNDAHYYHADYVKPKWRTQKVFIGKIDRHLFYRDPHPTHGGVINASPEGSGMGSRCVPDSVHQLANRVSTPAR